MSDTVKFTEQQIIGLIASVELNNTESPTFICALRRLKRFIPDENQSLLEVGKHFGLDRSACKGIVNRWDELCGLPIYVEIEKNCDYFYGEILGEKIWNACGQPKLMEKV